MQCPKCGHTNPEAAQYCLRCHTALRYTCPACKHVQTHSGQCDQCGVDFAKYAAVLQFQAEAQAQKDRERLQRRSSILTQILLLPITGGLSLLKYFLSRIRNE